MRRCLSFSYRGCAACRRPSPGGTKTAYFWRVLDVHKTSQIPSKMALGRGLFGARGGSSKKLNTRRKLIFQWFFDSFWSCNFSCKNLGGAKNIVNTVKKWRPGCVSSSKNCFVFDLINILKFKMWKGGGGVPFFRCFGRLQKQKRLIFGLCAGASPVLRSK